jgi:RNA polymerase sigma factor (sigma-70 family)
MSVSNSKIRNNTHSVAWIIENYGDYIRKVIQARAHQIDQADEIYQELFVRLLAKPIPQSVNHIGSYLFKIIAFVSADVYRRENRQKTHLEEYSKINEPTPDQISNPEESLIAREQQEKMFQLIENALPTRQAEAVQLYVLEGNNVRETADKMGIAGRSVARYASVGVNTLRAQMQAMGDDK